MSPGKSAQRMRCQSPDNLCEPSEEVAEGAVPVHNDMNNKDAWKRICSMICGARSRAVNPDVSHNAKVNDEVVGYVNTRAAVGTPQQREGVTTTTDGGSVCISPCENLNNNSLPTATYSFSRFTVIPLRDIRGSDTKARDSSRIPGVPQSVLRGESESVVSDLISGGITSMHMHRIESSAKSAE